MKSLTLIKNGYFIAYLSLYVVLLVITSIIGIEIQELLAAAFIIGIVFTSIAYFLSRSSHPIFKERKAQKNESLLLISIIIYFVLIITFYHDLLSVRSFGTLNKYQVEELTIGLSKLLFIVAIPILIYRSAFRFSLKDWGINLSLKAYFSKKSLIILTSFLLILLLFQYAVGNGARPLREGVYSGKQIVSAILPSYIWLLLTVGIVEEFFFRAFLQSRLAVLLKSEIGGIILSTTIFGLAHAPGIYLRGAGVLANLGPDPSFLMSISYSFLVLSVAGFFLSVIWLKTKNFWLIVAIHAAVDLLPNLSEFIDTWGI